MSLSYLFDPVKQFVSRDGNILVGGFLNVLVGDSQEPADTFSDAAGTLVNPKNIPIDSDGRAPGVFVDDTKIYTLKAYTSGGQLQFSIYPVKPVKDGQTPPVVPLVAGKNVTITELNNTIVISFTGDKIQEVIPDEPPKVTSDYFYEVYNKLAYASSNKVPLFADIGIIVPVSWFGYGSAGLGYDLGFSYLDPYMGEAQMTTIRMELNSSTDEVTYSKEVVKLKEIQSDWNQMDSSKPDYIKNKPDVPTRDVSMKTVDSIGWTGQHTYTMMSSDGGKVMDFGTIPAGVTGLTIKIPNGVNSAYFKFTLPASTTFANLSVTDASDNELNIINESKPTEFSAGDTIIARVIAGVVAYGVSGAGNFVIIGGLKYRTVKIGNQTWMAENLQLAIGDASFYDNDEATYGRTGKNYGRLYTWEQAMGITVDGWHLPTADEWDQLANAIGGADVAGTKLKSTTQWSSGNGTDDYGFSVFPAGYGYSGSYDYVGRYAEFWTATEDSSDYAYSRNFSTGASINSYDIKKSYYYSVRLVKDS